MLVVPLDISKHTKHQSHKTTILALLYLLSAQCITKVSDHKLFKTK